jgi:general L-amino acid transport system permease protein
VKVHIGQFAYGLYPEAERWRPNLLFALATVTFLVWTFRPKRLTPFVSIWSFALLPLIGFVLLRGGICGLAGVETSHWGGLMLTLVIASVTIVASLPLGIILALMRRSTSRYVQYPAVAFIELWRGVPLITVLFMSSVMMPLFFREGVEFNKLLRALIGITLFSSAYIAEVVRGGLNGIAAGQYEASRALGLSYFGTTRFVILPQALRIVLPGLLNSFISLFKDTTLVAIIGMFDFLGMIQAATTDPAWLGFSIEGYIFAGTIFWTFNFAMSRAAARLEFSAQGHKR